MKIFTPYKCRSSQNFRIQAGFGEHQLSGRTALGGAWPVKYLYSRSVIHLVMLFCNKENSKEYNCILDIPWLSISCGWFEKHMRVKLLTPKNLES